ncbi:Lrp/AsnC family transcriptional regulator [Kitasatospora sp. NBC_01250]|uniref:Lrp/AsnC family transcriptional regulator n=1 Tax=unclassified Kitasatospora TaxID=2633591 RepID=UPI002E0ED467|nr:MULTISPECIES: Lrp/AsnC family transcriptional regulator [unclassified Kitasatospora]WSJ66211.1 Lrp/AsnC family transcriptional regulator [Kitasatospora sp. NBC_01302]
MPNVRQSLDQTDRRIAAALLIAPRASWRTLAHCLELSERTVVRRAGPLYADGTLRATVVRSPARFPALVPLALRVRCRPNRVRAVAATLARRPDTVWVDVLGGGDEISTILFLDGPEARNTLLLRDLPATAAVASWTAHTLLRVFPTSFHWSGGLLSAQETALLQATDPLPADAPGPEAPDVPDAPDAPEVPAVTEAGEAPGDAALIEALTANGRAGWTELAARTGLGPLTARRRVAALVRGHVVRLATEVDLALLGCQSEALLWLTVSPGALEATGRTLGRHPRVRFVAATTGPANLLVAVAVADLSALYGFLTGTVGTLTKITGIETTPILATAKRTGLTRPAW